MSKKGKKKEQSKIITAPTPEVEEKKNFWSTEGLVIKPFSFDEILIEISSKDIPEEISEGYELRLKWKSITHDRFMEGLDMLSDPDYSRLSRCLTENLLGRICHSKKMENRVIQDELLENIPNLPKLNFSQEQAIKKVLKRELSLLQGPPGTGKTVTCAALVYYLIHENNDNYLKESRKKGKKRFGNESKDNQKRKVNGKRILVCAPSNVVVDHLLNIISKPKPKIT
jgi:regulator of nonsense transcripts 1